MSHHLQTVSDEWQTFESFYEVEFAIAYRSALSVARNRDIAWDATQEAAAKAYQRWGRLRRNPWAGYWMARVAMNEARRRVRRDSLSFVEDSAGAPPDLDAQLDVRRAIGGLPKRQMEAAILYYVLDLTQEDIAQVMGCSIGTVKTHLSRARASLAQTLEVRDEEVPNDT